MTQGSCPLCESNRLRSVSTRTHQGRVWTLARCAACDLHFTSPPPTDEEIRSFYAGEYHEQLLSEGTTESTFGPKYNRYIDTLGRHLSTGRVVDVGCSTGLLVHKLATRGYQAEGVELNHRSAEWGRAHFGVTIHESPLEECAFEPGSLDALLMTDVLEHTRHPRDYLREAGKLLRAGGLVLVTFPDIQSVESRYQHRWAKWMNREWIWENCHIPLHVWEFSRKTAEACFHGAGFRVVEFRRSQPHIDDSANPLKLRLLNLPTRILRWPGIRGLLGTQMEFVITKESP